MTGYNFGWSDRFRRQNDIKYLFKNYDDNSSIYLQDEFNNRSPSIIKFTKEEENDDAEEVEEEEGEIDGFNGILTRKSMMIWAKDSIERLPIRMTLGNIGIFAVFVTILMPRTFTYFLFYPLFRLVLGNLYPAYSSYKAVRTKNVKEYVKWMMYWIVFAIYTLFETFADIFLSFWFPFYYEIKILFLIWLLCPATKGSSVIYRRFLHPTLTEREAEIDEAIARVTEQGYTAVLQLGSKGVNYATNVIMQTAIKGGGGLVQHLKKSYSLADLTDDTKALERPCDEVDVIMEEPRLRSRIGRRGFSPRRTQSNSNRMDMYFSEFDVQVKKSKFREPTLSIANIKSLEDISSGYSSGELLNSQKDSIHNDQLLRTSSLNTRNRSKTRSSTKKNPEIDSYATMPRIKKPLRIRTVT